VDAECPVWQAAVVVIRVDLQWLHLLCRALPQQQRLDRAAAVVAAESAEDAARAADDKSSEARQLPRAIL